MILKYSLVRIFIIFLLVLLFPLVQNQWQNLYMFDNDNFTIYKLLYYLSGLICPIFVIINSLNNFTFYRFKNKINDKYSISGKLLLFLSLTVLLILSNLISSYIFINLKIFINSFISSDKNLLHFDLNKQVLFVVIFSFFLICQHYH